MAEPNDPTRSGPPLPDAGMVSVLLSRNEVEALATKAARGAGMDWGLAEETGFALGWLTARGLGCTAQLLEHLQAAGDGTWFERSPLVARGQWQAAGLSALCPVALGAALCDHAGLPEGLGAEDHLTAGPVSWPVLLLPFLATLARWQDRAVQMRWQAGMMQVGPDGGMSGDIDAVIGLAEATVHLTLGGDAQHASARHAPVPVCRDTMAGLTALAMKTTVPATAASRDAAGAGTTDND